MWTLEGEGGYGDSPKYIAEEIMRRKRNGEPKFEIVWITNYCSIDSLDNGFPDDIKVVKNSFWNRAYHLSTAGFWVGNTRTIYGTKKRRKTVYIQTWHAIAGIKPIGKQRGIRLPKMARIASKHDSGLIDYVLSGNEWSSKMWPDGLIYYGPILKTGIPRCDILFNGKEQMRKKYREKCSLAADSCIILYAPTFRGGSQGGRRNVNAVTGSLDFSRMIKALEKRFGGMWYVFLRMHPQVANQSKDIMIQDKTGRLIDVSMYQDMNELIAASDVFLTDYSSSIFEGAIMRLPGFLYVEDVEAYIQDRGKLMFHLESMPFPVAYGMEELEARIEAFDFEQYERDLDLFMKRIGIFEDGKASGRVVDFMEEMVNRVWKK